MRSEPHSPAMKLPASRPPPQPCQPQPHLLHDAHARCPSRGTTTHTWTLQSSPLWLQCPPSHFLPCKLPFILQTVLSSVKSWLCKAELLPPLHYLTSTSMEEGKSRCCVYVTLHRRMSVFHAEGRDYSHSLGPQSTDSPSNWSFFFLWSRLSSPAFPAGITTSIFLSLIFTESTLTSNCLLSKSSQAVNFQRVKV